MRRNALLLAVGCVAAVLAVLAYDAALDPDEMRLMGSRATGIADALKVWEAGGPPVTGRGKPFGAAGWETYRGYYPSGATDDVGIYLYLPALGRLFGVTDPVELLKLFFLVLMGVLFLLLPLISYHATGSLLVGFASPILLYPLLRFTVDSDVYWIAAWCYVLAIPLLVAAARQRRGDAVFALLIAAVLVASFANSVRSQIGVSIFATALAIGWLRSRRVRPVERAALALCVVAAYVIVAPGVITTVQNYRDAQIGIENFSERYSTGHPLWHPLYLGLGYLPNNHGISWDDSVAAAAVDRNDVAPPPPVYLSEEYEVTLRRLYFKLAREEPRFFIKTYVTKAGVVVSDAFERFPWLFATVPIAVMLGTRRHWYRRALLIAGPTVVLGAAPPLVAVPVEEYELGWLGALAAVALLTFAAVALSARDAVASGTWRRWTRATSERVAVAAGAALFLCAAAATAHIFADDARAGFLYQLAAAHVHEPPPPADVVTSWTFRKQPSHDWEIVPPATAEGRQHGLIVRTGASENAYQLLSPTVELPAGNYIAVIDATITGGMALGAFDSTNDVWLQHPRGFDGGDRWMYIEFAQQAQNGVRLILTNWQPRPTRSTWVIRQVRIGRTADGT